MVPPPTGVSVRVESPAVSDKLPNVWALVRPLLPRKLIVPPPRASVDVLASKPPLGVVAFTKLMFSVPLLAAVAPM